MKEDILAVNEVYCRNIIMRRMSYGCRSIFE